MHRSWILFPTLFLVLFVGMNPPAFSQGKKVSPIPEKGWCCHAGQLFPSSRALCSTKSGIYSSTQIQAQKACRSVKPGFCLTGDDMQNITAPQCRKINGQFFPDRLPAEMARRRQNGWCLTDDHYTPSLRGGCSGKGQQFYLDKAAAEKAWKTQQDALHDAQKDVPARIIPKKSGMQAVGPSPQVAPRDPTPLLDESGGIQIITPSGGVLRAGTAITVTYRFSGTISDQPMRFEIFSGSLNRVVAETTHRTASGKTAEAQGGALAKLLPRERSFTWSLPWGLSRSTACFIQAEGGGLSGRSDIFAIEPAVDMGADSQGIEVLSPKGGELLRAGGLITVRYRITHPLLAAKGGSQFEHFNIRLKSRDFMDTYSPFVVESGDKNTPETDIVFRLPDDLPDRENFYTVRVASTNQNGQTIFGISKAFSITSATTFGDATSASGSPGGILEVVAPNGGEYWNINADQTHTARWRLRLTGGDHLPGEWHLIFMRHTAATGFEAVHALTPDHVDAEEISWEGQTAFAFSTVLPDLSDKLRPGRYKLVVKGLDYQDLGDGFFSITRGNCGLAINGLTADSIFLSADVSVCEGIEELTFRVEEINRFPPTRVLKTTDVTVSLPEGGGPVSLGVVETFVNDLGAYDCGLPFQVTVDPEAHIDSSYSRPVLTRGYVYLGDGGTVRYYWTRWGFTAIGGHGYSGEEMGVNPGDVVYWAGEEDFAVCAVFKNCGHQTATGAISVRQQGDWADPGRLAFSHHNVVLKSEDISLNPGQEKFFCINVDDGLVMAEGSTIEFDLTRDMARWASNNTVVFYINRH